MHPARVEVRALDAVERRERHARMHEPDRGAVLGRDVLQIDHGADAAGARHVLHHDVGLARDCALK